MVRSIPPCPFAVEELIPELAGHARTTTLLYPRAGTPGVRDSSVGGPLLWPADEPWPVCPGAGHDAMVPVVQLFARDVPELLFPAGTDLLQIVWCPCLHDDRDEWVALPRLYWRDAADVSATGLLADPPRPSAYDEDFLPRPCTVSPTPALEYPNWDMPEGLSGTLGERFEEIEAATGHSYYDVATTIQSKVGGYPGWTQPPDWPDCACGRRMEHLLSITAAEPAHGRCLPYDDHAAGGDRPVWLTEADPAVEDGIGHGMDMGDLGGIYFFVCRHCPETPYAYRYDC
ncbi:YwqG family protein [Streptomyces justiciae]|uniref:hypothetical protein n=1 Tax=Streptomyces justiciae TaxID=2780140 RepID=UPI0021176CCF|nr:hypothetical protein [Streptomyces justiciae]MCW8382252.1 hypothetical protein [Streptomyces justiciae]